MATRSVSDENELTLAKTGARGLMRTTLLFSVFTNLLMLTGPLFMLQIYDRVLGSRSEETLVALTGLVTGLFLLYGLIEYARGRVLARAGARFQSAKSDRVFRAALDAMRGNEIVIHLGDDVEDGVAHRDNVVAVGHGSTS